MIIIFYLYLASEMTLLATLYGSCDNSTSNCRVCTIAATSLPSLPGMYVSTVYFLRTSSVGGGRGGGMLPDFFFCSLFPVQQETLDDRQ